MVDLLVWLFTIELIGLAAFPIAFLLFRHLPDRGFSLVKPLALVVGSYALWVLGLTHLVPVSRPAIIVVFSFIAISGLYAAWTQRTRLTEFLRREWPALIAVECVFLAFFLLWAWITSEFPVISGTEKPMDFGLLNASIQANYFPPEDPWLSGYPISYYYFGYLMMGFLAQMTGIVSNVSYNLSISLVPALAAAGVFGLTHNLVRLSRGRMGTALGCGMIACILLLVIGNLEGVVELIHSLGWGGEEFWAWVGVKGLEGGWSGGSVFPDQYLWWWRATRVIDTVVDGRSLDYTITEFPMFSFLLGDLHPHVMSLPFNLLALSASLHFFASSGRPGLGWLRGHPGQAVTLAIILGSLAFINAWDFPAMAGLFGVLLLVKAYRYANGDMHRTITDAAAVFVPVVALAVMLFLPFYLSVDSQVSGVLPVTGPGTRPLHFTLVIGFLAFLGASFLLRQLVELRPPHREDASIIKLLLVAALLPFLLWADIILVVGYLGDGFQDALLKVFWRGLWVLPALAVTGVAGYSAVQRAHRAKKSGDNGATSFSLIALAAAFYLLAGVELFYVVDLFGNRMNTVFKVYYQAWLLLSVAGAYGLFCWVSRSRRAQPVGSGTQCEPATHSAPPYWRRAGEYAWTILAVLLLMSSLYYPVGAVLDRTGLFGPGYKLSDNTLNGLAFVESSDKGEYDAILWLRNEAPWGRIVEAVGDDYSDFSRISASTGLPTILGWKGHELQWRGSSKPFSGREKDVAAVYQSGDPSKVKAILERYDVRYVYFGPRERDTYGIENLGKLSGLLKTAWEGDDVVVYEFAPPGT